MSESPSPSKVARNDAVPHASTVANDENVPNDEKVPNDDKVPNDEKVPNDDEVPNDDKVPNDDTAPPKDSLSTAAGPSTNYEFELSIPRVAKVTSRHASFVWKHMKKTDQHIICLECAKKFQRGKDYEWKKGKSGCYALSTSTASLKKHLRAAHNILETSSPDPNSRATPVKRSLSATTAAIKPPSKKTTNETRLPATTKIDFLTTISLNLQAADAICNGAIAAVSKLAAHNPVCVTVLDSHGGILVQKRMDDCPDGAHTKISLAKARTCIHLRTSSRQAEQFSFNTLLGEFCPIAGGVLILDRSSGATVGAIGVSGATADEDEYLALQGVRAVSSPDFDLQTVPNEELAL